MRWHERFEGLLLDAQHALASLRRDPLLAVFLVVILGVGLGANIGVASLGDRLLRTGPIGVTAPEGIGRIYRQLRQAGGVTHTATWLPWAASQRLAGDLRTVELTAAYRPTTAVIGDGTAVREVAGQTVSGGYFTVLGATPAFGRYFTAGDDATVTGPQAVISNALWRGDFGADPGVIGQTVRLNGTPHLIVAVAPPGFSGTEVRQVEVWQLMDRSQASFMNWVIIGRLRNGLSVTDLAQDADQVLRGARDEMPGWFREATLTARSVMYNDEGEPRAEARLIRMLGGVSVAVLLIILANAANLLTVRLYRRQREMRVRMALGGTWSRVARLLLMENLVIALLAAGVGIAVAGGTEGVIRRAFFDWSAAGNTTLDRPAILVITLLLLGLTVIILTIVPVIRLYTLAAAPGGHTRSIGEPGRSRVRASLTVAQSALSLVLLVGAGLYLTSIRRFSEVDLGMDAHDVLIASVSREKAPMTREAFAVERTALRGLAERLVRAPGVNGVAVALGLPLDGGSFTAGMWTPGADSIPALPGGGPHLSAVSPDFFETLRIPLIAGRTFTPTDREGSAPVVVVGEALARTLWTSPDAAVAQCLHIEGPADPCSRVVGVVADVNRTGIAQQPSLQFYLPLGQEVGIGGASLVIRTTGDAGATPEAIRSLVYESDPAATFVKVTPLLASLDPELRPLRIGLVLFTLAGGLGVLVAGLGLYGLMAYLVAWRTPELALRMAMGAGPRQIASLVLGAGLRQVLAGIAIGVVLLWYVSQWLQPHLFATSATDPGVLVGSTLLLLIITMIAGWLPVRRAGRVQPATALRTE